MRVPAVVVSPYSRPGGVTDVIHDHTSVLATIEAQWNLPALTYRDANAATLADFLDVSAAAFLEPPSLAAPGSLVASEQGCSDADLTADGAREPRQRAARCRSRGGGLRGGERDERNDWAGEAGAGGAACERARARPWARAKAAPPGARDCGG